MIEFLKKHSDLILVIVFGLVVGFSLMLILESAATQNYSREEIDFSGIYERIDGIYERIDDLNKRLDRTDVGIVNSSIDFCFSNGGSYPIDESGNIFKQEIDGIEFSPCIWQ